MSSEKLRLNSEEELLQESMYLFPYHYIPHFDERGLPRTTRSLDWGIEYLTYMQMVKEELASVLPSGGSLLDVGCGDGYFLNSLGPRWIKHGIDLSANAIGFAKAFATDALFEVQNIKDINKKYDAVTCIEVLEHIQDGEISSFIDKIVECINPNGFLIISVPTTVLPLNKKHYRHYDETLLSAQIPCDGRLSIVSEKRICRSTQISKIFTKTLNNKYWTINAPGILRLAWNWYCNRYRIADMKNGAHLLRVYQKI